MHELTCGNELKWCLKDLRQQLNLIDAAIAALSRYRDLCRQELKVPAPLPPLRIEPGARVRQAEL